MACTDLTLPRRTRVAVVAVAIVFHLLLVAGLIRAFAPNFTAQVANNLASVFVVTVTTPEPPLPPPPPNPEPKAPEKQGAAAPAGKKAKPKPESAPETRIEIAQKPAPKVASAGDEYNSGAQDRGEGTGAGGIGEGTGAGGSGTGQGGGAVQKLEKIAGDINSARDYPKATRKLREGHFVTIQMTVGTDGRPSNCQIVTPSPDAEADRITCRLAVERFRFRPRTNAQGIPVPGEYRWRQRWWDPRD